ncbi:DUF2384 domain-containing protein [Pseudomonas sp. LS1212]|uniref:antitoxin Xre/MbcA/ParS toxin-binding domain-containing protein n=1 Tax=Pseudomonas sp. LS1212 TaxID=2972478 RepID=UPI00215CCD87|nr:antitoxin Xre/MbcA/ParS toxin-binding domain-containing protein [Pseudomonas sp. LS1212]UVJ41941.1 DUF2384 domain-containing protein [Pseudomonas sp. LS1212]
MDKLYDKLGLPKGHYRLHHALLAGLPVSLAADLARELGLPPARVTKWVGASTRPATMPMQPGEIFCRLVETLDVLLERYDDNLEGALHWPTTPNMALANERPADLLVTETGRRTVQQAIHAIEYGLPV